MKKLLNTVFFLIFLPAIFTTFAVMRGANVWIAGLLIYGLPSLTFIALGVAPTFMDWFNKRQTGESENDRIDKYLREQRSN